MLTVEKSLVDITTVIFVTASLKTFSSLLNGQPDLITFQGMEFLVTMLKSKYSLLLSPCKTLISRTQLFTWFISIQVVKMLKNYSSYWSWSPFHALLTKATEMPWSSATVLRLFCSAAKSIKVFFNFQHKFLGCRLNVWFTSAILENCYRSPFMYILIMKI